MNSKQIKRVVEECVTLINSVDCVYFKEDIEFRFISEDTNYRVIMDADLDYYIDEFDQKSMLWEHTKYTLDECDTKGIKWQFTQDILDRFEDTIMEVEEHIRAHESDIGLFSRLVDSLAGETLLSCL